MENAALQGAFFDGSFKPYHSRDHTGKGGKGLMIGLDLKHEAAGYRTDVNQ